MGKVLEIDLENGYTIMAVYQWDKELKKNYATFYLRENSIPCWDLIEDLENVPLPFTNKNTLKSEITDFVEKYYESGKLDYYIARFQYQQECFNIGSEANYDLNRSMF